MLPQLPLGINLRESACFDTFIGLGNQQTIADLKACLAGSGERYLYLWGPAGAGKSHLLQASCRAVQPGSKRVAYIPLSLVDHFTPGILSDLGELDLVCLDDIHLVCEAPAWESSLFSLFNQLWECRAGLIVSADRPPARLPVQLADLASRLEWGLSCQLNPLDDVGRVALLDESAKRRGLHLPKATARYILSHTARDATSLLELMERLDLASLAAQRSKLTIHFVKTVLEPDEV
ncbi:MAG: DnaA regulatory inactivator Hda [Gammaproteobacteria bacterium]|nr:DnaA regulatory inactivator Hda [Gammaproteobacteria bacterium]